MKLSLLLVVSMIISCSHKREAISAEDVAKTIYRLSDTLRISEVHSVNHKMYVARTHVFKHDEDPKTEEWPPIVLELNPYPDGEFFEKTLFAASYSWNEDKEKFCRDHGLSINDNDSRISLFGQYDNKAKKLMGLYGFNQRMDLSKNPDRKLYGFGSIDLSSEYIEIFYNQEKIRLKSQDLINALVRLKAIESTKPENRHTH